MKNLKFLSSILVASILFSCSSEETIQETNPEVIISSYVQKNYNVSNSPNTIFSSINYEVVNNKIVSSVSSNANNATTSNAIYSYSGNKLSSISGYQNNSLTNKQNFVYDANLELIEYRQESYNSSNQITAIQKHSFIHTPDTIFSQWNRSTNNGLSYTNIANFKIVLDQNQNRTYFEEHDLINNEKNYVIHNYDASGNVIYEENFLVVPTGGQVSLLLNSASYSSNLNPLTLILEKTYGRKMLMMLYHLQTGAINNINLRTLSPNTINTYSTTFDNQIQFQINNTNLQNNYATICDYKTIISGNDFARFSLEFNFE